MNIRNSSIVPTENLFFGPVSTDWRIFRANGADGHRGERTFFFRWMPSMIQVICAFAFGVDSPRARGAVTVIIGNTTVARLDVSTGWQDYIVSPEPRLTMREGADVINNAASFLEEDGTAGDRGIFEPDRGQYDEPEDVTALCGCSMLISRAALDHVGLLDSDFFMYYEDTELCWRLRKSGYRLRYQPSSVVRHIHAATSGEWSPTFTFLVGRNRVLMLLKHASARTAIRGYLEEVGRLLFALRVHRSLNATDVRTRLRIQRSLLRRAPRAVMKRFGLLPH